MKYFEDDQGFVYKRVNENEKTVYLDCLNKPRCLAAAKFYKKAKQFCLFGNHAAEICPPDGKMKTKIHFEEFLKKDVVKEENAGVSVLNVYKQAIENRYNEIWLPENYRQSFLPVLRRIRNYKKADDSKTNKSKRGAIKACDVATSSTTNFSPTEMENSKATASQLSESNRTLATVSTQTNEQVCVYFFTRLELVKIYVIMILILFEFCFRQLQKISFKRWKLLQIKARAKQLFLKTKCKKN